jgi:hypothetical protein
MCVQSLIVCNEGLSGYHAKYLLCDMDQTQEEAAPHSGVWSSF